MEEASKKDESESEQSESESYETCDSGVSDDEGSTKSESSQPPMNRPIDQRARSLSDSEFSDALDRYANLHISVNCVCRPTLKRETLSGHQPLVARLMEYAARPSFAVLFRTSLTGSCSVQWNA